MKHASHHLWGRGSTTIAVLLLVSSAVYAEQTASPGYANAALLVTGQQLAAHLEDSSWRIVDVRSPQRYAAGHIPGAVNLPLATITRTVNGTPGMLAPVETVTRALGERGIAREHRVVIYDDFGGDNATRLFWVLDYLGHPRPSLLQGGLAMWLQAQRPVSQEAPQIQGTTYEAMPNPAKLADLEWVKTHLQTPGIILLDARSPGEFSGQVPGRQIDRPGRIPGAVNLDWVNNLTPTPPHQFKSGTALAALYQDIGVTPDNEIVVYCRTGMRASHDYFVLRLLGYSRVRMYDGSFVEWSANTILPVER